MINVGDKLNLLNLYPVALVSATGVGSAIDLKEYEGEVVVALDVGAGTGDMTCAIKLTECATSGGSYTDVTSGGFTTVTTTASAQKISLNADELKQFVKLSITLAGTSPEFLVSGKIFGIKKEVV